VNKTVLRIDIQRFGSGIGVLPRKPKFAVCISLRVFACQPRDLRASFPFSLPSTTA
ncbi:unnamed protein product, partial [Musa banksii]